jgi:2-phospho-L-lactate transferase
MTSVVVLAGGTGGAKLARGMLDVVGEDLTVIANTADDIEIYGAYVSPDPDLCTFWLADLIDERGWGLRDDSFAVMDGLRELGADVWFALGDRDLAIAIQRQRRLGEGARLTDTLAELGAALGVKARVLPMSDEPVRTRVRCGERWMSLQEFLIRATPSATARLPSSRSPRSSAATSSRARRRRSWPRRAIRRRPRASRPATRGSSTGSSPTSAPTGCLSCRLTRS